jgi:urease accessory protein
MESVIELMLSDGRTPTGGHAHSAGLEAAVDGGLRAGDVPAFMRARLRTVGRCEAAIAAAAAIASLLGELLALDLEAAARTPAEPFRGASRQLGRGLLRTACKWWPDNPLLAAYHAGSQLSPRPVALGAVARAAGLSPVAAARLSLYDDAATVVTAAVKLLPLDAAVAGGWIVANAAELDRLAVSAAAAAAQGALPSTSTPLLDRRSLSHALTERRLFVS